MRSTGRTTPAGVVLALGLALGATACSGGEEPDSLEASPSASPQDTERAGEFDVETRTTVGVVAGRLGKDQRRRAERAVTDVVQRWFDRAYVGGQWPRSGFRESGFPGFTRGARAQAVKDVEMLTNKPLGERVESVTPTASRITLDLLAAGGRPVAGTARFRLAFETEGKVERHVVVSGRLMLTRLESGWRIFGYDVTKGDRA
jgi:hypothetical protein